MIVFNVFFFRFRRDTVGATTTSYVNVAKSEASIQAAVATVGPIAVAIDASGAFGYYKSGIYSSSCSKTTPNHAVLIVGYGTTSDGKDYWLVKNSWGTSWGEKGYIRIARNVNMCGIAGWASYPKI